MAVWAIGDIQGCAPEFRTLLKRIRFSADRDRLWLAGDLVNRGGASLTVLRQIYAMRDNLVVVLGNHDLHLLAMAHGVRQRRRERELKTILRAADADRLLDWLVMQPLLHIDRSVGWAMVHAGLDPRWTLTQAGKEARAVEKALRSRPRALLKHMYGNQPAAWSDKLTGWARLRTTINVMTRMRFCDRRGRSAFSYSGTPENAPAGKYPWFEVPGRKKPSLPVVFGHWSALGLLSRRRSFGLDTGCVWGGFLTAARIDGGRRKITQVRARRFRTR